MFCANCGKKLEDDVRFCSDCGVKIQAAVSEKQPSVVPDEIVTIYGPPSAFVGGEMSGGNAGNSGNGGNAGNSGNGGNGLKIAIVVLLTILLMMIMGIVGFVVARTMVGKDAEGAKKHGGSGKKTEAGTLDEGDDEKQESQEGTVVAGLARPTFMQDVEELSDEDVVAKVPAYTIEKGLKNVTGKDRYYLEGGRLEKLEQNGFVVLPYGSKEFFGTYEHNRYQLDPNFVTVDSLMHIYHLYFAALLKTTERDYLYDDLLKLSENMLSDSEAQYEELEGTIWEDAAKRNVAYFAVGLSLLKDSQEGPDYVSDLVSKELALVGSASDIETSPLFEELEDYSQYKPRGYYEGDSKMESYFRGMMWYGRRAFNAESDELTKSAILMTIAMDEGENQKDWDAIYAVTSFFCGASDDLGYCEYKPLIEKIYGEKASAKDLADQPELLKDFLKAAKKLDPPKINSIPIEMGEDNVIPSFRFMGQRFTVDAEIMQNLIYSRIEENSSGELRMLPDVLDVCAALGSETAYSLLEQQGDTKYKNFPENMEKLIGSYKEAPASTWNASLYAGWLNTLRPLLKEKGEGYPMFMQSTEWAKRDLECFAGSYTELKHDTILYSKQVMAEMGDGEIPEYDDRGYVQPEPIVFARFLNLAKGTSEGLKKYGMLSYDAGEDLDTLAQLAQSLRTISEKELRNEGLTDEEYDLIRNYGGNLEHLWSKVTTVMTGDESPSTDLYPAALVADVATDPNGSVLELATGGVQDIMVICPVEGKLKICIGTVYSFYQFPWNMNDRLTDSKWRQMIGMESVDEYTYNSYDSHEEMMPEWVKSYRVLAN